VVSTSLSKEPLKSDHIYRGFVNGFITTPLPLSNFSLAQRKVTKNSAGLLAALKHKLADRVKERVASDRAVSSARRGAYFLN
jgi:hypothetical protein